MSTSLSFRPTAQISTRKPNKLRRNTYHVNDSGEIRTEPPQKSLGPKPRPKIVKPKEKKEALRGMGVERLERLRIEQEMKNMVVAQGFGSGQIPVYPPWCFVVASTHDPSLIPNHQMYNPANNHSDTSFKKQDGDQNVVLSTMVPPPMNGNYHLLPPDQMSQGSFYDQRVATYSAPPCPYCNKATNPTGSMEENPRNGTGGVKEYYEFFPGNCDDESVSSVSTSVDDCCPNASTIDLSLKL